MKLRHLLVYEEALTPDQCRQMCRYLEALSRDEFDWDGRLIVEQWDEWIERVSAEITLGCPPVCR